MKSDNAGGSNRSAPDVRREVGTQYLLGLKGLPLLSVGGRIQDSKDHFGWRRALGLNELF